MRYYVQMQVDLVMYFAFAWDDIKGVGKPRLDIVSTVDPYP